jgi:hypothetical protein
MTEIDFIKELRRSALAYQAALTDGKVLGPEFSAHQDAKGRLLCMMGGPKLLADMCDAWLEHPSLLTQIDNLKAAAEAARLAALAKN